MMWVMATVVGAVAAPHFLDLGTLLVEVEGSARSLGGARPTAALAVLLINANRRVSADAVGEALWADGRRRSTSTLESHLWRLRQVLEPRREPGQPPSVLVTESGGYRLVASADQVDSLRFEHLVEDAAGLLRQGSPHRALRRCEEALALWRGRPFEPVADREWAMPTVARLLECRAQLDERRVAALLGTGEPERALLELEAVLARFPLREQLWGQRMLAAYRCGRVDAALQAFQTARRLLVDELGVEPGEELRQLHGRILAEDPTLNVARPPHDDSTPPGDLVRLPARSSRLIGRGPELADLDADLRRCSLVTLTGAAGTGKTRLAVEAARTVADAFPDGIWFVDLTPAQRAEQVADAVASALGAPVPPTGSRDDAVRMFTRDRRMLLLLDNCEQVLDEVAGIVERLLASGPELTVLLTSREALELDDERVVVVEPLGLPEGTSDGSHRAASVELFLERLGNRAGAARNGEVDRDALVARICRAVDGIPLAIELAAARARTFSLAEVAEQVELDPSALSQVGARRAGHRSTVRAAIEWSHRLLTPDEQILHRSVSVLPGPFTLLAAAAVAGTDLPRTAELLADLAHRSLVVPLGSRTSGRPSRFAQLTTVRGHGTRALADAGETANRRDRRNAWLAELVTRNRPRLGTPEETAWFERLDDDLAAVRATLQHTLVDAPSPVGAQIVAHTGMYWYSREATLEGRRWTELATQLRGELPPFAAALLDVSLGAFWGFAGRGDLAGVLSNRGLQAVHTLSADLSTEELLVLGDQLTVLSGCLWMSGEPRRATKVIDRVATIVDDTGDPTLHLLHRIRSGVTRLGREDPTRILAEAVTAHDDALVAGNHFAIWFSATLAALAAVAAGDVTTALHWSDTSLAELERAGETSAPLQRELRGNILVLAGRFSDALDSYDVARRHNGRAGVQWPSLGPTAGLLERARSAGRSRPSAPDPS